MQWRRAACLLLIGAAVLGTAIDRLPERRALSAGGYRLLAGDFHVHGFPGDGGLAPWALRTEARRAGIDVFAQTNHNQPYSGRLAQWVGGLYDGPIMIAGEEVTSADYHLIAVGIHDRVRADQSAAQAIAAIHAQGGIAIAAHPGRGFRGWTDEAVAMLDGAEVAHPMIEQVAGAREELIAFYERGRRLNPGLAAIGSSDVHMSPTLAVCRTLLFTHEATAAGVLDAIRHGRTVAMDPHGRLYGPPELVRLAAGARPPMRVDVYPVARRLSLGMALIGGLGVLLLGRSRRPAAVNAD
jgi:predicted metal-dependent phosphoesterase TrpH